MRRIPTRQSSHPSTGSGSSLAESVAALAVTALVVASVFASAMNAPAVDTIEVQVTSGDTLWAIARAHPVEGMNTAQAADLIAELNGVHGTCIAPGMTLSVPVRANDGEFVAMR